MYVNVGRFRFRPMGQDDRQSLMRRMEKDLPPLVQESPGFRGLYLTRVSDNELMTVWLWDSQADWDAAFVRFGPLLQEYILPNVAQPPERVGGEVVLQLAP